MDFLGNNLIYQSFISWNLYLNSLHLQIQKYFYILMKILAVKLSWSVCLRRNFMTNIHHIIWLFSTLANCFGHVNQQCLVGASQKLNKIGNATRLADLCSVWWCLGQFTKCPNHIYQYLEIIHNHINQYLATIQNHIYQYLEIKHNHILPVSRNNT